VVAELDDRRLGAARDRVDVLVGAAERQPEVAERLVDELVAHVHVPVRKADIELQGLEDRRDAVSRDTEHLAHTAVVEGTRTHPLVARDPGHLRAVEAPAEQRHQPAVVEVAEEHVLPAQARERRMRQLLEAELRIEGAAVVIHGAAPA